MTSHIIQSYASFNKFFIQKIIQRCIKFIWTLLHSPNIIVKSVMRSAIRYGYSTLGENFRYLSYKYDLSPTLWISPLGNVYKCINDYVTDFIVTPDTSHFIR